MILQNSRPPDTPQVAALLTRLRPHELVVADAELLTLARHLALTAPPRVLDHQLTPEECVGVLDYLAGAAAELGQPINLRLVAQAYEAFAQHENGDSDVDWADHVRALVAQRTPARFLRPVDLSGPTRLQRDELHRQIVLGILAETSDPKEQVRLFAERAGRDKSTFYKFKTRLEAGV